MREDNNKRFAGTILGIAIVLVIIQLARTDRLNLNKETLSTEVVEETTETVEEQQPETEGETQYDSSSGIIKEMSNTLEDVYTSDIPVSKEYTEIDIVGSQAPVQTMNRIEVIPVEPSTIYTSSIGLNIREDADANSTILTAVPVGTELVETAVVEKYSEDTIDTWVQVEYDNIKGYVKSDYISESAQTLSLGMYEITYYCPCAICCDIANRKTASGTWPREGVTVAADPSIPFGTKLVIDGVCYTVEDRGGLIKGNKIDIFLNSHNESLLRGTHLSEVFVVVGDNDRLIP